MNTNVTAFPSPPSTTGLHLDLATPILDLNATPALGRGSLPCFTPASSHFAIPRQSQLCLHASDFLCRPAVPSFLLPGRGHATEALRSPVWLDVASQAASLHKSHVNSRPSPSLILDATRLSSLSITTSVHWELGAEYASSAAAGFSAVRLAASLSVWLDVLRKLLHCIRATL